MDNLHPIVFMLVCFSLFLYTVSGQSCAPGTSTGPNSLLKKKDNVDVDIARTFVHTDMQYMFQCCGVIEQWSMFAKNPGNISLQVWRPTGVTLQLVGQNNFFISSSFDKRYGPVTNKRAEGTKTLPVPVSDRITVQYADYIGWFSDAQMITYSTGSASDAYSLEITYDDAFFTGGGVANWGSSTAHSNRLYALIGVTTANSVPYLSDLSIPREFYQSDLHAGDSVLVAHIYDVDRKDSEFMALTRLDSHGVYFNMAFVQNSTHNYVEFVITNIPPVDIYTIQFEVQDICFNVASASVKIIIKYRPLAIQSLPNVVTVHSNKPGPVLLHTLVVQSDLMFGCTIKSVSPAVLDGVFIIEMGNVMVVDPSDLSPSMTYTVNIECTDSQGTNDAKLLTVNCLANTVPRVVGFKDSALVDVFTTTVNDIVHNIVVVDDESDDVTVLSYCDQDPCPFQLLSSGDVICTDELNGDVQTKFTIHFGLTDGYLMSKEYILNIYLQNINTAPYISNLMVGQKNTLTVSDTTEVGTFIFRVNGMDSNPLDVLAYTAVFDPLEGASYFAYSITDGSLMLVSSLNYTSLQLSSMTVFVVNITVSDGKAFSDDYILEIKILPGGVNNAPENNDTNSSKDANPKQSDLDLKTVVLAAALGLFALMSLVLCVMMSLRKTRSHSEDLNGSTGDLISTHNKFRVVQVEPSHGQEPIVRISKPRMTSID